MRGSGRRLLAALAAASALAGAGLATAGLRSAIEYPVGNETLETEFVRLPGDRRLDLVVTNRGDDDLSVLRGRRNGRLSQAVDVAAGQDRSASRRATSTATGGPTWRSRTSHRPRAA